MARQIARHSFMCSRLARGIAGDLAPGCERDASTAALLHDIGKLLVLTNSCEKLATIIEKIGYNGHLWPNKTIEEEMFGFRYTELGSCLLLWWNLPMGIVEAIAGQEYPVLELRGISRCIAIADHDTIDGIAPTGPIVSFGVSCKVSIYRHAFVLNAPSVCLLPVYLASWSFIRLKAASGK